MFVSNHTSYTVTGTVIGTRCGSQLWFHYEGSGGGSGSGGSDLCCNHWYWTREEVIEGVDMGVLRFEDEDEGEGEGQEEGGRGGEA